MQTHAMGKLVLDIWLAIVEHCQIADHTVLCMWYRIDIVPS